MYPVIAWAARHAPFLLKVFPLIPMPGDTEQKRFMARMAGFFSIMLVVNVLLNMPFLAMLGMGFLLVDAVFDTDD